MAAVDGRRSRGRGRGVPGHHRALGLGQDHAAQPDRRVSPLPPRAGSSSTASTSGASRTPSRSRLRNEKVGFVFQFPSLLPTLTTLENVVLPATFGAAKRQGSGATRAGAGAPRAGGPRRQARGLPPGALGRTAATGRAGPVLVNQPRLLLADEPSSNLDEHTEAEIMQSFRELHDSTGITILMVTHTSQLKAYGTRAIEMAAGRVVGGV